MNFFRFLVRSKAGKYIAGGILLLIALAFAVTGMNGQGGLSVLGPSSAYVAQIGSQTLTVNEVQSRAQRVFERFRQEKPDLTMSQFLAQGGLKQLTDEMIAVKALIAYGDKHGMRISKKLIDAEIARIPAFQDATGNFSETQFKSMLAQQHIAEKELREDLAGNIMRQHLLLAAAAGVRPPDGMLPPYAAMLIEKRDGEAIAIPSQSFAPAQPATDMQLKAFFAAHLADFALPEQRKLRYLLLTRDRFLDQSAPTDAEIAAAYKTRAALYAPKETRDLSQLILPTEAQAKDLAAKAAGGKSLADLAKEAGLSATPLNGLEQANLASTTSAEIAKAAFAAQKGALIGPFKSPLGWALLRVEGVHAIPGKTLDQAKPEIVEALRGDKSRALFSEFVNKVDGKLGEGATLADVAKANGLEVTETPLITAQGKNLRDPAYKPDDAVNALLKAGFGMAQGDDPQIVQVKADDQVAVLVPGDIVAAGPPPFAEVRNAVELEWKLAQGAVKARDAATKVAVLVGKGVAAADALKQAGVAGQPAIQPISIRRADINQQNPVPPPVTALLTMRTGSAKVIPMTKNLGFMVVRLATVTQEDPRANAELMNSTRAGLGNALGAEYAAQLTAAIEKDVDVRRNAVAMASIEQALRQANGAAQ